MSYLVLARKYRPQNFDEVIGQDAVVTTLKNAIQARRIHQAYLFTGVRGTGKTSLARIFSKALNCEQGPTAKPCNHCSNCRQITEGSALDVREIDGASNTSVEDVRELREELKYLPASGRYKIFIIDEVHMLSTSAFNALLKTLEEPPPHAVFFMATTEAHKIPATILSRCQRFDLRRVSLEKLQQILKTICELEKVEFEPDVLLLIAREAQGSIRDAQSLLDQAMAYASGKLKCSDVAEMLGLTDASVLQELTRVLIAQNLTRALVLLDELYDRGHDLKQFCIQWLELIKNLLLYRVSKDLSVIKDLTESEQLFLKEQAALSTPQVLDLMFQILHQGIQEMSHSEFPKMILEVLLVRLAYASQFLELTRWMESGGDVTVNSLPHPDPLLEERGKSNSLLLGEKVPEGRMRGELTLQGFLTFTEQKKPQVSSILSRAMKLALKESEIFVKVESNSHWLEWLKEREEILQSLAKEYFQKKLKFVLSDQDLMGPFEEELILQSPVKKEVLTQQSNDPTVSKAMNILNAKIEEVTS
ncbi:MAG: DNA polymerase III subunit gamma/tau [Deltaproteobacteria bacterium]|nr:DNA polymerase III subunit gamma/tau [Deltaproteobacteria bacterium]